MSQAASKIERLAFRNASHMLNIAAWPSMSGSIRHPLCGGKSPAVHQTSARADLPPRQNHIHDPPKTHVMKAEQSTRALMRHHSLYQDRLRALETCVRPPYA